MSLLSPRRLRQLRAAAVALGAVMVLVALFADQLGLDHSPAFGTGETLLLVAGCLPLLAGLLGKRLPAAYKGAAIVLLNTAVLLAALELAAVATSTLTGATIGTTGVVDTLTDHYHRLPYYAAQEWTSAYWRENAAAAVKQYRPYVGWRRAPFGGETIEVDAAGIRRTPSAECGEGVFTVYTFGGSTMWGWGSPDWGTIPAYLQAELAARHRRPVCVVNYGETAFVSTQGLMQLALRLQAGDRPDLVIFYDGVNEVLAAHQSGEPVLHQNHAQVAARFESPERPLLTWLQGLHIFRAFSRLADAAGIRPPPGEQRPPADVRALADAVVDTYLGTCSVVAALAGTHGFEARCFWQPHVLIGAKPLTAEEEAMLGGMDWALEMDGSLAGLFRETYQRLSARAAEQEGLVDLSTAFDGEPSQIWIDTWGHVTPAGNEIVARAMLPHLPAPRTDG